MMIKAIKTRIYNVLLIGLLGICSIKTEASAPVLPYAAYIVPVTLGTLCAITFGWSWLTSEKVTQVDKNLELVAVDVKEVREKVNVIDGRVQNVQNVQADHTQRLNRLQASSDGNFTALGNDVAQLKQMTEKGFREASEGQKKIMSNVDEVRGLVDRRFDEQARELAQLKAAVEQLHKNIANVPGNNVAPTTQLTSASQSSTNHRSGAPLVYQPLFPAKK